MSFEAELQKSMQENFRQEMNERILAISQHLSSLEESFQAPTSLSEGLPAESYKALLRELHNLKGAARVLSYTQIEQLTHALEALLLPFKAAASKPDFSMDGWSWAIDRLYDGVNWLDQLLNRLTLGQPPEINTLLDFIAELEQNKKPGDAKKESKNGATSPEQIKAETTKSVARPVTTAVGVDTSIQINGAKLDDLLAVSTELLVAHLRVSNHQQDLAEIKNQLRNWSKLWRGMRGAYTRTLQGHSTSPAKKEEDLLNLLHFLEQNQQQLKELETRVNNFSEHFERSVDHLAQTSRQIQFETRRLRLVPLNLLVEELERVIRQLSHSLGKQAYLVVSGAELELDKKLLGELRVVLLHLIRNALDHGIESPSQRIFKGKSPEGQLKLVFRQQGHRIEFELSDDGAGIDREQIKQVAVKRGLITQEEIDTLSDNEIIRFIFNSGFSTRSTANEISGRGVGMDVVQEIATHLSGSIDVESEKDKGTSFIFSIPNFLFTTEGILAKSGEQLFIFPVDSVVHAYRVSDVNLVNIGSRQYLLYSGIKVPVISMAQVLGLKSSGKNNIILVLYNRNHYGAIYLDDLLGNQEVVVKNFSKPLMQVRYMAGATVLPDKTVALIVNTADLMKIFMEDDLAPAVSLKANAPETQEPKVASQFQKNHILVVDDSITTRTLEKNILEVAGFSVQTARDGLEALEFLKHDHFDLVITDVEMPIMDGYQLTREIKQNPHLAELPVVVVTSLGSDEDKAKGLQAGADAYIVKNSFDQQSLLTTIRQLV
ncbi:MAG: response regulator [Chloroflexi bacterium]|uniref:histidine kinase n=1 Tax=Candidatus Chlorohelix allophototropha TaxID=3003348 RepID=A0A8T7M641_9CHLR|nr:response regulator [Chloroflexota bacterium]WJW69474.1 response regulator [Chloroflexota bacterium L227-S17]